MYGCFSEVKFAVSETKYGSPGLKTVVVVLLKQNAMHYACKLFGTALQWF